MANLEVSVLEGWGVRAGHRYTGRQSSSPLSIAIAGPSLLPSNQEAFEAAIRHHGSKTVICPNHIALINALRLGAPHRHTADIIGRGLPLSSHQASECGCGVEHEALFTLITHFGVAGVFWFVDRI